MEPALALADLLAASPHVDVAALFGGDDEPLGSVGLTGESAAAAVRAGRALLRGASRFRGVGEPTQVHASLSGGDVFVVGRQGGPAIVAVTGAGHPAGLVFHELKRCLDSTGDPEPGW